jgi:hypothetical protein
MAFEIRVPMGAAFGRLRPTAVRMFRAAPGSTDGHDRVEPTAPPGPREEDVELAVREYLYGRARAGDGRS